MQSFNTPGSFPFNEKSYLRSKMLMVPKIENELDRMMEKTRNIPTQEIEGEWKFHGYFPKTCKKMPLCHMDKIEFTMDSSDSKKFKTFGTKTGQSCSIKDRSDQLFGNTWINDSYMQFRGKGKEAFSMRQTETPFIFDKHP